MPAPSKREGIAEDRAVGSAEAFLALLASLEEPWVKDPTGWIYRGQGNAEWPLNASALRSSEAFKAFGIEGSTADWSARERLMVTALKRFRSGLDASAVPFPVPPPEVDASDSIRTTYGLVYQQAYPLMALAQHHGLPTLLLDWSRRAHVAAYVAAASAVDPATKDRGTHMAVWALHARPGETYRHGRNDESRTFSYLQIYQAPAGTNPNMRAQAGLFTILFGYDDPSVEAFAARGGADAPDLWRVTLPHSEAPKLLRLLSYEGITGASMFPGSDGVVRSMREEQWWDEKPKPPARKPPWTGV